MISFLIGFAEGGLFGVAAVVAWALCAAKKDEREETPQTGGARMPEKVPTRPPKR